MKKMFVYAIVMGLFALNLETVADSLSVSFTSKEISGKTYSPQRDVVVYILNATGKFIRTVGVWGFDRSDCQTWATLSKNNIVDAVSSATVSGASSDLSVTWNGTDTSEKAVPNGTYWLCLEATASDKNASAPRLKCKIVLDGTSKTSTTADSSLNNGSTYFTALNVSIIGNTIAVRPSEIRPASGKRMLSCTIGHSRIAVPADGEEIIAVDLFTLQGAKAADRVLLTPKDGDRDLFRDVYPGMYIVKVSSRNESVRQKVLVGK
jgi:hypothetical protein